MDLLFGLLMLVVGFAFIYASHKSDQGALPPPLWPQSSSLWTEVIMHRSTVSEEDPADGVFSDQRCIEKHDAMVSALRDLQQEVDRLREELKNARSRIPDEES